jgi:hypothetical protein
MKKKHRHVRQHEASIDPRAARGEGPPGRAQSAVDGTDSKPFDACSLEVPAKAEQGPSDARDAVAFDPDEVPDLPWCENQILFRVWQPEQMLKAVQSHNRGGGSADRENRAQLLRHAIWRGPERMLEFADPDALRALRETHGQFASVLKRCEEALAVNPAVPLPPLLLVSDCSLGKTLLVEALAACLRVPLHLVDAPSLNSSAILVGGERRSSTAAPGLIYTALIGGQIANPLFALEGIDKVSRDPAQGPIQQLHLALDPTTAVKLTDQYTGLQIDASRIRWVLTAESLKPLPQSLLSRVEVHHIKPSRSLEPLGIPCSSYRSSAGITTSADRQITSPNSKPRPHGVHAIRCRANWRRRRHVD